MKKLILCGSALLLSLGFSNAQGWATNGAHDDFATTTPYTNGPNSEGIIWFETTGGSTLVMTRNTGNMSVSVTNAGGCTAGTSACYPVLGLNFNDSNGDGSGTPYTVDLSSGANITVDVENTSTDDLFMSVALEDINSNKAEFEPNISDVLPATTYGETDANSHYKRKALNGFTLTAGTRKTITIDLSSVPGAIGGLTAGSYGGCGTGPYYCPTTSYTLDPSQIRDLIFLINFGGNDINLSEGDGDYTLDTYIAGGTITPYNGVIKFYDFKIGTVSTPAALNKTVINNSLTVYPSPAKESLTVSFDANETTDVTLSDIVGNKMLSASANAGSNKITMNTSNLSSGIYILNVSTENGKVARKVVIE